MHVIKWCVKPSGRGKKKKGTENSENILNSHAVISLFERTIQQPSFIHKSQLFQAGRIFALVKTNFNLHIFNTLGDII